MSTFLYNLASFRKTRQIAGIISVSRISMTKMSGFQISESEKPNDFVMARLMQDSIGVNGNQQKEKKMTTEQKWLDLATSNTYRIDVRDYLKNVTGGVTQNRVNMLNYLMNKLNPNELEKFRVEECQDENTGRRYGLAKKRINRCFKIGGGGRNCGSRYAYQVWAVWA